MRTLAKRIRKRLGRWKCVVLDQWPYIPLGRAARRQREQQRTTLQSLPSVARGNGRPFEVHMLCGHKDADMGVWAGWSLLRFLPSAQLFVHSDGSLDESDRTCWRRMASRTVFTTPEERQDRAARLEAAFPTLHKWKKLQIYGSKFIDAHLFGSADRILLLDSDVLCFREPTELLEAIAAPDIAMRWNRDLTTSYSATPARLREILGCEVPEKVNSGFLFTKRWDEADFAFFEEALGTMQQNGIYIYDRWAEQTMYALAVSRHQSASPFPSGYDVTLRRTGPAAVVRHYVGVPRIRPRFHTEGVPILMASLRSAARTAAIGETCRGPEFA